MSAQAIMRSGAPKSGGSPKGRVLMVSTSYGVGGGAEEQVTILATGLSQRGWHVRIVSLLPIYGSVPPVLAEANVEYSDLGMRKGSADPRAIARFVRIVREFQPDIVHSHMTHANLLARSARLFVRFPALICTLHGLRMFGVTKRFTLWRELGHRLTDRMADLTTTICEAAAESYRRSRAVPDSKLAVIVNGVDVNRFSPNSEIRRSTRAALDLNGRFAWLAVGRLEKPKAYDLMIRAFAACVSALGRNQVLLICGSGSLQEEIESLIRAVGLTENVRLLGLRNDVPDLMRASDAFVLSSETEGLPMALLQAAASQLPLVATDVGGNREIVIDGKNGFLTPSGDIAALSDAMIRLATLPEEKRTALGKAGRDLAHRKYSTECVLERWEETYGQCLNQAARQMDQRANVDFKS